MDAPEQSSSMEGRFSYQIIQDYVTKKEYPPSFSKEDKRSLRRRAQYFTCKDGQLYYSGKKHIYIAIHILYIVAYVITWDAE